MKGGSPHVGGALQFIHIHLLCQAQWKQKQQVEIKAELQRMNFVEFCVVQLSNSK